MGDERFGAEDWRVASDYAKADKLPVEQRCKRCEGTGNELMFMYRRCTDCGGSGESRD